MNNSIILSFTAITGSKLKSWQYLECYQETERGLSANKAWISARKSEGDFGTTQVKFSIKFLISSR
jgi:hypothetical protein